MRLAVIILVIISQFSCARVDKVTSENIIKTPQVTLQKGACFGTCPVYTFHIYDEGYCEFIGELNTKKLGKHGLKLANDKYENLISLVKKSHLETFEKFYESNIPDAPTVAITSTLGENDISITGKAERPKEVLKLQMLLEQVAENHEGWYIIDGSLSKTDVIQYDKTKFIITFSQSAQLTRWFNNAKKLYGIRILKQVSQSDNRWIVSYSPHKFTPEEMYGILNNDAQLTSAEFLPIE